MKYILLNLKKEHHLLRTNQITDNTSRNLNYNTMFYRESSEKPVCRRICMHCVHFTCAGADLNKFHLNLVIKCDTSLGLDSLKAKDSQLQKIIARW